MEEQFCRSATAGSKRPASHPLVNHFSFWSACLSWRTAAFMSLDFRVCMTSASKARAKVQRGKRARSGGRLASISLIASSTVLITDGSPEARTRTSAGRFIKEGLSAAQRGTDSRLPGVTWHLIRRSPDFPPPRDIAVHGSDHLTCSPRRTIRGWGWKSIFAGIGGRVGLVGRATGGQRIGLVSRGSGELRGDCSGATWRKLFRQQLDSTT